MRAFTMLVRFLAWGSLGYLARTSAPVFRSPAYRASGQRRAPHAAVYACRFDNGDDDDGGGVIKKQCIEFTTTPVLYPPAGAGRVCKKAS